MFALTLTLAQTTAQVRRARELCRELPSLFADTVELMRRSRRLCLTFPRMSGGSDLDAASIVEIIGRTPMCLDCLSKKTGIPADRATEALEGIRSYLHVKTEERGCEGCLQVTTVYGLADGAAATPAAPSAPIRQTEAIWAFLESRRGQMLCTQCIVAALRTMKRIDRAILAAEGRGARRQYGNCAACGRERLLCGLMR